MASRWRLLLFNMRLSVRGLVFTVFIFGLSVAVWQLAIRLSISPWYVPKFEQVSAQLQRLKFVSETGVKVIVYRFDPDNYTFRIEHSPEPERISSWSNRLLAEHILINGFYFLENYLPAGMLITNGQLVHETAFDFDKSGLISLAPDFRLVDTQFENFSTTDILEAGQSYPFMLKQGVPAIKTDSGLVARRSFIGTDNNGLTYLGVVAKDDISLFELMHVLTDIQVDWQDVINLDGGPSTGIAVKTKGFVEVLDSLVPVPNIIVIEPK